MAIPPRRIRLMRLRLELEQVRLQHNALVAAIALEEAQERPRRRRRRWWVKPWIQRRLLYGQYDQLMNELMRESEGDFKSFMRMEVEMFREMLVRVTPHIQKSRR